MLVFVIVFDDYRCEYSSQMLAYKHQITMKEISIWHVDGLKTLDEYINKIRTEFPGVPFNEIKVQTVNIRLSANTSKQRSRMRRVYKAQI